MGADRIGTYGLGDSTAGLPSLTAGGAAVTYALSDTNGDGLNDTLVATAGGQPVFTLEIDEAGTYLFTLQGQLDHPVKDGNDNEDLPINLGSVLAARDQDGDVTGTPGSFVIAVEDDVPVGKTGTVSGTVDEDNLPTGNEDGDGELASTGGDITGLFSMGADRIGTYGLGDSTAGLPSLTAGGAAVTYALSDTNGDGLNDTLVATAGGQPVFTLEIDEAGTYLFTLQGQLDHPVKDGNDNEDLPINLGSVLAARDQDGDVTGTPGSFVIAVEDDVPIALNDTGGTVAEGSVTILGMTVLANDRSGADKPAVITSISYIGEDNSPKTATLAAGGVTVDTKNGSFTMYADGTWAFTSDSAVDHSAGEPLPEDIQYTIVDYDGDTATAKLTINITDTVPDAKDDAFSTREDEVLNGNVSTNDSPSKDLPSTFTKLTDPAMGTVNMNTDGTFTYTPVSGFSGEYTFTYQIMDADGDIDVATVTINVADAPQETPVLVVGRNVNDTPGSQVHHVVPNPNAGIQPFGEIQGGSGNDILIGDYGGNAAEGKSLNLVLILDQSGSMKWAFDGAEPNEPGEKSRMTLLKESCSELFDNLAASGALNIRVHLVSFSGMWDNTSYWKQAGNYPGTTPDAYDLGTFDLKSSGLANAGGVNGAKAAVNAIVAGGGTNYEAGLLKAIDWWKVAANPLQIPGVLNETIFLSDGDPTFWYEGNTTAVTGGPGGGFYANAATIQAAVEHLTGAHTNRLSIYYPPPNNVTVTYDPAANFADTESEVATINGYSTVESIGINVSVAALGVMDVIENEAQGSGAATNVMSSSQLSDTIQDLTPLSSLAEVGADSMAGKDGVDVMFGDAIYTDTLANSNGLSLSPGAGWAVIEELEAHHGWTREQSKQYILDHHAQMAVESLANGIGRLGGNDTMDGGAGADIMYGQEGDDTLIYDHSDTVVDGGSGTDTLRLQNGDGILFGSMPPNPISDIEIIDLRTDGAANVLTDLAIGDVQAMTDSDHKLYIHGGAGDSVTYAAGWNDMGPDGVYEHVYVDSIGSPTVFLYIDLV